LFGEVREYLFSLADDDRAVVVHPILALK